MPEGEVSESEALRQAPPPEAEDVGTDLFSQLPEINVREANSMPSDSVEHPQESSTQNVDQFKMPESIRGKIEEMTKEATEVGSSSHQTQSADQIAASIYARANDGVAVQQTMSKSHPVKRFVSKMISSIKYLGSKVKHMFRPTPKIVSH